MFRSSKVATIPNKNPPPLRKIRNAEWNFCAQKIRKEIKRHLYYREILKSEKKCNENKSKLFVLVCLKFKQFLFVLFSPISVHCASGIFANQSHVAFLHTIHILTIKIYISCVFPIKSTISHILIWIALDNSRDFLSFIFLDDLDFKNGNVWFTIQNARISST